MRYVAGPSRLILPSGQVVEPGESFEYDDWTDEELAHLLSCGAIALAGGSSASSAHDDE